jgi:hypothetical protein
MPPECRSAPEYNPRPGEADFVDPAVVGVRGPGGAAAADGDADLQRRVAAAQGLSYVASGSQR